jgi:hypothetical protein
MPRGRARSPIRSRAANVLPRITVMKAIPPKTTPTRCPESFLPPPTKTHAPRAIGGLRRSVLIGAATLALCAGSEATATTVGPFAPTLGDRKGAGDLESVASELQEGLARIGKEHAAFFDDRWLKIGGTHFGLAQQAAKTLVVSGQPNAASINEFHNRLDEFLRAIDSLAAFTPGTTGWGDVKGLKKPTLVVTKQVHAAVAKVKAAANQIPEFQEVALITFSDATTTEQAVDYGTRVCDKINVLLYSRGLEQITGIGGRETTDVIGAALGDLRTVIAKLGDDAESDGDAADKKDAGLAKRVAAVKKCIGKLRDDSTILAKAVSWAKKRIELMEEDLSRLEKNLDRLKPPKKA